MTNILDKGEKHLRIRKKNGEDEIYWILCLEPKDYAEFIKEFQDETQVNLPEKDILRLFTDLGLDIRLKKEAKKEVLDETFSKGFVQSIIA